MEIALITDTHAGGRNDSSIFNEYFLSFFEDQFFPYLKKNNINTIIHLGDVFDRRKYMNFNTLHSWRTRVFDYLRDNNIDIHIVLGNHDVYYKNTNKINSVRELLGGYENIKIYEEATTVNFNGTDVLLIPWINNENKQNTLDTIKNTKADIAMGHLELSGFQLQRGFINDHGLSPSVFEKMDMVISGHYHHKSSEGRIYYMGNPYEMVWTDYADSRGFSVFNTQTRELKFLENPRKIFVQVFYNDEEKKLEDFINEDFMKYKDLYIKVIIESKTNPYIFDQYIEGIQSGNPADVKIVENFIDNNLEDDDSIDIKDTLTILTDYIQKLNIDNGKDQLVDIMRDLYIEAANMDKE